MKGFKTIAFNAIMAIVAVAKVYWPEGAESLPGEVEVQQSLDVFWKIWAAVQVVGNGALRTVTNTPMFKKA